MWVCSTISTLPKASRGLDRGYVDFARLYQLVQRQCDSVVGAEDDLERPLRPGAPYRQQAGVYSDQTILLMGERSRRLPKPLRRVLFYDSVSCLELVFLTNRSAGLTIAAIYKQRWQVELFFKWLRQNLNVKHFFGNSFNAVRSQIWIAVCTYLRALIAHKPFQADLSLRNFLHLVKVNMFEKIPLAQMVANALSGDALAQIHAPTSCFETGKIYRKVVKSG